MWLIQLLPTSWLEFAALMILVVGAIMFFAGQIFKFLPFVRQYNFPLRLLGGLLLLAGAYFNGGLGVEMEYRARIEEMQAKIAVMEKKSAENNKKIEEKIAKDTKVIKQDTDATLAEIEKLREQINSSCELTPDMIELYNKGVKGKND